MVDLHSAVLSIRLIIGRYSIHGKGQHGFFESKSYQTDTILTLLSCRKNTKDELHVSEAFAHQSIIGSTFLCHIRGATTLG
ncbi:hypothetical protein BDV34DRAFT_139640 [Aspergillus parasiticus]|uniref:Uncharacterized protein n=1 Tax=Aspergillus parasiticus TaxID=5067 RepID=A0A5N6DZU2_ASPPA|nr:hypothetical protein BDV34DRAFT_139640 [Aspergillus parasiticus]